MNKSASKSIEESVKASLTNLSNPSPNLILGVSGGPDSMALLYALHKLNIQGFVVHVNYGLRGKESDLDQELVEGMSVEWGFECCSVTPDKNNVSGNFQNWAREERYRIFREMKNELRADAILTAHHQDDQVETILQKLFRGSGPEAWQGLKVWDGELLRPFLPFTKQDIIDYCKLEAIPYRIDESNLESGYARNFIRKELSESLSKFFPGWEKNILMLEEKGRIFESATDHIFKSLNIENGLELKGFVTLDEGLKTVILKKLVEHHIPGIKLSRGLIKELTKIEYLQNGASIEIDKNHYLVKERSSIDIKKRVSSGSKQIHISKEEVENGLALYHICLNFNKDVEINSSLYLDSDLLSWPLTLRVWEKGDRFRPLGMSGSQKVSDHLTNRKISSSKKEKALILNGADGTIYAIIFPEDKHNREIGSISEIVKCTGITKNYLTIKLK